jgi:D-sedoheptulose 7-phosphate isomerase
VLKTGELEQAILRKSRESGSVKEEFFAAHAERIVECGRAMLARFEAGGRLFVMGNGGSACDAQHVAVEFMHPVVEKRRAWPAIALTTDTALLTAVANDRDHALAFGQQLRLLGRPEDMALGLSTSGKSASVTRGLRAAKEMGMLSIGFTGRDGGSMRDVTDHCFIVPSYSIHRIQEVHETLLHILWDTLHLLKGEEDVL